MSLKMNSSLRFPENRRLRTDIDSFLIDPLIRNDMRRHRIDLSTLGCEENQDFLLPQTQSVDSVLDWSDKEKNIKDCLHTQIKAYKQCIKRKEKQLHRQQAVLRRLVQYAKVSPLLAAEAVSQSNVGVHHWTSKDKLYCVAASTDEGKRCRATALPYSKYCLQHILSDNKQILYKKCTAIDSATSKQCQRPVLEILQDKSYCRAHMRLATHTNEFKKSTSKLAVPTGKGQSGKRKVSPSRTKRPKVTPAAESSKPPAVSRLNPLPMPTLSPLAEPFLTQASAPSHSAATTWNTSDDGTNDATKKLHSEEIMGDGGLLPPITPTLNTEISLSFASSDNKNDTLLPFSPNSVNTFSCPPLPPAPQVGLMPLDPTLMGNFLDSDSSGDEQEI